MVDIATFGWPQWVVIVFLILAVTISAYRHGQNVKVEAHMVIIGRLILLVCLIAGGFFS